MKFLLNYHLKTSILFWCFFSTASYAHILKNDGPPTLTDREILIEIYEMTNGDAWLEATNWYSDDIATWYGVEVLEGRVISLNLANNNLTGAIPESIKELDQLKFFDCSKNKITALPDMSGMENIERLDCRHNLLTFEDLEANQNLEEIYHTPQQAIGITMDTIVCLDSTLMLPVVLTGDEYRWMKDGSVIENGIDGYYIQGDGTLLIEQMEKKHQGTYVYEVQSQAVPSLILRSHPIIINLCELDSLGGPYRSNQLVLQFDPSTSGSDREQLLDLFNSDRLDDFACADLELWLIPDTVILAGGDTLITIEEIKDEIRQNPGVQEVDLNHLLSLNNLNRTDHLDTKLYSSITENDDAIKVAILDTGIDTEHYRLVNDIWKNSNEVLDRRDNDENCAVDDINGVNFVAPERALLDDHSHGTHVAGIIQDNAIHKPKLLALKTHDQNGIGDIFRMTAAIYYARDEHARIVNMSTGYYGQANQILRKAIEEMQADDMVFVASAGNSGRDVDSIEHYPSGYDLDNIVAVASVKNINATEPELYSNYGQNTIDVLAIGTNVISTIPGDTLDTKTGTSMSAAVVSGILADAMWGHPGTCYHRLLNCLYQSGKKVERLEAVTKTGRILQAGDFRMCCTIPDHLSTEVISGNVAKLSWDRAGCTDNYQVAFRKADGDGNNWIIIQTTTTLQYLNNLEPNTPYEWKVSMTCTEDISYWSAISTFTTTSELCDYPTNPDISVTINSSDEEMTANIFWGTGDIAIMYALEYRTDTDDWILVISDIPSVDIPINYGVTYSYRIKTQCIDGWTNWSPIYEFTVEAMLGRRSQNKEGEIQIYPNPVRDQLTIQIGKSEAFKELLIKQSNGQIIEWIGLGDRTRFTWNMEHLPAGIYFMEFIDKDKKHITHKLIKIPK